MRNWCRIFAFTTCLMATDALGYDAYYGNTPVVTDSRIKTFVYNENDVYSMLTHYGYQCNIEFGRNEEIETVSVGDRIGWQIVPSGRRLFIRAMEENAHTNMTVVTNRRAYQFDLRSSGAKARDREELVYVVRFYYPDDPSKSSAPPPPMPAPSYQMPSYTPMNYTPQAPAYYPPPMPQQQVAAPVPGPIYASATPPMPVKTRKVASAPASENNYQYSFSGPDKLAPTKMYDDGQSTYFKFRNMSAPPKIYALGPGGNEESVNYTVDNGYIVVDRTAPQFLLRKGEDQVTVYNDAM